MNNNQKDYDELYVSPRGTNRLQSLLKIKHGIVIAANLEGKISYALLGQQSYLEALDEILTALSIYMKQADEIGKHEHVKQIYDTTVLAFSQMMDEFYPEAVKIKNLGTLSDEEIIAKENEAIEDAAARQGENPVSDVRIKDGSDSGD